MDLRFCTFRDVEQYLRRSQAILIAVGSIEQHGEGGLIGTDSLCAELVARGVAEREQALLGPTIAVGMAQFNLAFPGTISTRPSTLAALVEDYVVSLASQGFRRLYFVNGHGGNIAPLRTAIQEVHAAQSMGRLPDWPVRCRVRSWWEGPKANALRRDLFGAWEGFHVTPSEVAITLHAFPSERAIDWPPPEALPDHPLVEPAGDHHYDAAHHRGAFPHGQIGSDPRLATAEHGQRLLAAATEDVASDFAHFAAATDPARG